MGTLTGTKSVLGKRFIKIRPDLAENEGKVYSIRLKTDG